MVRPIIRIENFFIAMLAIISYFVLGGSWWVLLLLVLVPDLSMLAYLINPKVGSYIYNLAHSYTFPIIAVATGWYFHLDTLILLSLICIIHIGIDRAIGFGLKYPTNFKDTHIQHL